MGYTTRATGRQGTRRGTFRTRRKRAGVRTRINYQAPTARNQKRQLQTISKIVAYNRKQLAAARVYTDWYQANNSFYNTAGNGLFRVARLNNFTSWNNAMRENIDVITQSSTWIREMQFSWYLSPLSKTAPVDCTMYIVTIRPSNANWAPQPTPATDELVENKDYVRQGANNAPILNSGNFKVLWSKHCRVFPSQNSATTTNNGNPFSYYRMGKTTIRIGYKVRSPNNTYWQQLPFNNLPPTRRYYLFWYARSSDTSTTTDASLQWGTKFTCINQD